MMKTTYLIYKQVNGIRQLAEATPEEWDAKEARDMTDELMEQRVAELNARNTEKAPVFDSEKRAYSVDDIMSILDISRSSAYILIKKNFFRSVKIGNQLRISKASFDKWLDNG